VADRAGSEWPKRARDAALVLAGDSVDGGSIRTQLLADIRLLLNDETKELAAVGSMRSSPPAYRRRSR
jgi:hypothetical protein